MKLRCYRRLIKKTLLPVTSMYIFLNFRHLAKYFAQIYRAQYGATMLVYVCWTQTEHAAGKWCKHLELTLAI